MPNTYINRRIIMDGINYDVDAKAYFDQLIPQPSVSYKRAVNTLVLQLKYDGNWTKLDRLWIFATENQQNARISLVNPTSTAITEVNTPTWTANQGYTGNGATMYLNTNYNPSVNATNYTLNSASIGVLSLTDANGFKIDLGGYSSAASVAQISPRHFDTLFGVVHDAAGVTSANTSSIGFFSVQRSAAATTRTYLNGALQATGVAASVSLPNINYYILARNDNGVVNRFSDRKLSLAYIGSGTIDQATLYNAINNFKTTIGF